MGISMHDESNDSVVIKITGRFDFSMNDTWRELCESFQSKTIHLYQLDLSETSFLDSSGLGMLLLLWFQAGEEQSNISLINPNDEVRKTIIQANLDDKFTLVG